MVAHCCIPYNLLAAAVTDVLTSEEQKFIPPDAVNFFNFNPYNLLAGLIFGTIGWGAWSYGKRLELWQPRAIGVGLMVYPYLISNEWLLWGVGVGLLVLLWFYHYE